MNAQAFGGSYPGSPGPRHELANIHADVACDGAEKSRRDVSALVKRNCRHTAVRMSLLAVRTALANLSESQAGEDGGNLPRLQNRDIAHR